MRGLDLTFCSSGASVLHVHSTLHFLLFTVVVFFFFKVSPTFSVFASAYTSGLSICAVKSASLENLLSNEDTLLSSGMLDVDSVSYGICFSLALMCVACVCVCVI